MTFKSIRFLCCTVLLAIAIANPAHSAPPPVVAEVKPVSVEHIKVHSPALEANLEGESADRDVIVYLPPSYSKNPQRRYPVVYSLHGYNMTSDGFAGLLKAPQSLEGAFAQGAPEVIVVLPDTQTLHGGSMYSSSVTIGDWEGFIADDLVRYVDAHYRTISNRTSRGLNGHSMGGYGATRIGMKRPDVFGALYIMSPCCLSARGAPPADVLLQLQKLKKTDDMSKLGFLHRATLAVAAAWSPNPLNPPFYLDLPPAEGSDSSAVLLRWAANAPLVMVDQYGFNLKRYKAIAMDVGDQDNLRVDASALNTRMKQLGVATTFEIYHGDHGNAVGERFQTHVLPFFGKSLSFE